jgi:hypothetical protein
MFLQLYDLISGLGEAMADGSHPGVQDSMGKDG